MIKDSGRKIRLEIDGGVGVGTIKKLSECGVDMFVVGRGVFHADVRKNETFYALMQMCHGTTLMY